MAVACGPLEFALCLPMQLIVPAHQTRLEGTRSGRPKKRNTQATLEFQMGNGDGNVMEGSVRPKDMRTTNVPQHAPRSCGYAHDRPHLHRQVLALHAHEAVERATQLWRKALEVDPLAR